MAQRLKPRGHGFLASPAAFMSGLPFIFTLLSKLLWTIRLLAGHTAIGFHLHAMAVDHKGLP
jgi:hypothetical protein